MALRDLFRKGQKAASIPSDASTRPPEPPPPPVEERSPEEREADEKLLYLLFKDLDTAKIEQVIKDNHRSAKMELPFKLHKGDWQFTSAAYKALSGVKDVDTLPTELLQDIADGKYDKASDAHSEVIVRNEAKDAARDVLKIRTGGQVSISSQRYPITIEMRLDLSVQKNLLREAHALFTRNFGTHANMQFTAEDEVEYIRGSKPEKIEEINPRDFHMANLRLELNLKDLETIRDIQQKYQDKDVERDPDIVARLRPYTHGELKYMPGRDTWRWTRPDIKATRQLANKRYAEQAEAERTTLNETQREILLSAAEIAAEKKILGDEAGAIEALEQAYLAIERQRNPNRHPTIPPPQLPGR